MSNRKRVLAVLSFCAAWASLGLLGLAVAAAGEPPGTRVSLTGELEVVIADDFAADRSETFFWVREEASGRSFELRFAEPPGQLRSGQRVTVRGLTRGRAVRVEAIETSPDPQDTSSGAGGEAAAPPIEERAAVVLMVDLTDAKASDRYTLDQVAANMWTGSHTVDGLYREASYLQLSFPDDTDGDGWVDAFGPFAIDGSGSSCDYNGWAQAADAAATGAGVDLSLYRHRIYILPRYNDIACTWAGLAHVGCGSFCRSWIAEGESPMVYAHELGHNLGMGHASTDPENDGVENQEYGDLSDPMGISRAWHVFNGAHADQMRWFDAFPGSLVTVAAGGVYDLRPINVDPLATGGVRALKIEKTDSGEFYYLSYRHAGGYDASLSSPYTQGVSVHRYPGFGSAHTQYIDTLLDGESFEDPANGLSVTQLGRASDGSYVTVAVAFGCAPRSPAVEVAPASQATEPAGSLTYTVTVTNQDGVSCGPAHFDLDAGLPPGLSGSLLANGFDVGPGETGTTTLEVTAGEVDGRFDLSVTASRPEGAATDLASAVVDGTPPSAPSLSVAVKRKSQVALSWSGASDGSGVGISHYRIHREDGSGLLDLETSGTSYTDRNTSSGATYTYTVFAVDALGHESPSSNSASVTLGSSGGGKGGGSKGGGRGGPKR